VTDKNAYKKQKGPYKIDMTNIGWQETRSLASQNTSEAHNLDLNIKIAKLFLP